MSAAPPRLRVPGMLHHPFLRSRTRAGFTLVEVALTIGIIAGTALVVMGLVGTMHHQVRRLKAPEAKPRVITDTQSAPPDQGLPDDGRSGEDREEPPQ